MENNTQPKNSARCGTESPTDTCPRSRRLARSRRLGRIGTERTSSNSGPDEGAGCEAPIRGGLCFLVEKKDGVAFEVSSSKWNCFQGSDRGVTTMIDCGEFNAGKRRLAERPRARPPVLQLSGPASLSVTLLHPELAARPSPVPQLHLIPLPVASNVEPRIGECDVSHCSPCAASSRPPVRRVAVEARKTYHCQLSSRSSSSSYLKGPRLYCIFITILSVSC